MVVLCSLVVLCPNDGLLTEYWEIIVTKPYLVSKEAQLYSLLNGEKSSSILFGETFLLAN